MLTTTSDAVMAAVGHVPTDADLAGKISIAKSEEPNKRPLDAAAVHRESAPLLGESPNVSVFERRLEGVDGWTGVDGAWYDWTKSMPVGLASLESIAPFVILQ